MVLPPEGQAQVTIFDYRFSAPPLNYVITNGLYLTADREQLAKLVEANDRLLIKNAGAPNNGEPP